MQEQPLVSVIIPVYNTKQYLPRCLNNIINQTLKNIEIICINDGSTDNSLAILQDYQKKDNRILIINCKNAGAANARNLGLAKAQGEYIGFCDSDDFVDLEYYSCLYTHAKENDADVVRGIRVLDSANHHGKNEYGCIIPAIVRREFVIKINAIFPTDRVKGEDSVFKWTLFKNTSKIFECPDEGIYYHYMRREGSLSNYNFSKSQVTKTTRKIEKYLKY